jgi:hypothetical protein
MKAVILLVVLFVGLEVVGGQTPIPGYKTYWYPQTLDHFNFETSPQTWQQRYLINDDWYNFFHTTLIISLISLISFSSFFPSENAKKV